MKKQNSKVETSIQPKNNQSEQPLTQRDATEYIDEEQPEDQSVPLNSSLNKLQSKKSLRVSYATLDNDISKVKLQRHIEKHTPTKSLTNADGDTYQVPFGLCDDIGWLAPSNCCVRPTQSMSQEIGLGPALFLMSTKAYAWFFLLLSLINIPLFLLYARANNKPFSSVYTDFSLGNVGQSYVTCESSQYGGLLLGYAHNDKKMFDGNRTLRLECLHGSKLGSLLQIGFTAPGKTSGCGLVTQNPEQMEQYFDPEYSINANTNFTLRRSNGTVQQLNP